MQRYFVDRKQINETQVIIDNQDAHHIKDVMRFNQLDKVIINTYDGVVYLAEIRVISKKNVILEILENLPSNYQPLPLDLGLSLIKKDNFELVLQKATELGVRKIIPLNTERSIIKVDDFTKKFVRYQTIVKEASEQSERSILPVVTDYTNLSSLDLTPYQYKLFCYAREESLNIKDELKSLKPMDQVLVLIGPEGDFSKTEIEYLVRKGFKSVSLGKSILRSETAAIYVVSLIRFLLEDNL